MSSENKIFLHCPICNKKTEFIDKGTFHKFIICSNCNKHHILKETEKIRLIQQISKNKDFDREWAIKIMNMPFHHLTNKTKSELMRMSEALAENMDLEDADKQYTLIIQILNDRVLNEQKEDEITTVKKILERDISFFENYQIDKLILYRDLLIKYSELDNKNMLSKINELIIKIDPIGKTGKRCKNDMVDYIINLPIYMLSKLSKNMLLKYKKHLKDVNIEDAKEQFKIIENLIIEKSKEKKK